MENGGVICTYCPDDRTDVIIRLGCHVRVITGLWLLVRDKNKHALTRLYLFTRSKPGQHVWMYNVMLINSLRTLTLWSHVEPFIDGNINSTSNNVWLTIDNKASERSPQSKSQRLQPNLSTFPRNMQAIWIN